ncbi:substrate-binding domain-containing protein [Psychromonas sp. KJ10-10]|uniref:substrate-binding domain-containing protein n=1 Tax=Psychromonas sp. KJ10-10 TaxID=3391823 RepID=UPI0039B651D3
MAQELQINIPNDLQILGFDGIATALENNLTTIAQPIQEKGMLVAQVCLGIKAKQSIILNTELIVNTSA